MRFFLLGLMAIAAALFASKKTANAQQAAVPKSVSPEVKVNLRFLDGQEQPFSFSSVANNQLIGSPSSSKLDLNKIETITFDVRPSNETKSGSIEITGKLGTRFFADSYQLENGVFDFRSTSGQSILGVSRDLIHSIKFAPSVDTDEWRKAVDKPSNGDRLVINRNGSLDLIEGVIKTLGPNSLVFETQGREATVQLSRLAGVTFFQVPSETKNPKLLVVDVYGNRIGGDSFTLDGKVIRVKASSTETIRLPLSNVRLIDFSVGRYVYLDELKPVTRKWEPYFRAKIKDPKVAQLLKAANEQKVVWSAKSSFGKPLMVDEVANRNEDNLLGRKIFDRGMAIRGGTHLVYRIPTSSNTFTAEVGIQSNPKNLGSVILTIEMDGGKKIAHQVSCSDSKTLKLSVPCAGERVTISVGYADDSDVGDIVVLGNARFQLKK